jgi:hypothetical protein
MDPTLIAFIQRYLGVANTGDTPANRGQCVGLIEVWSDEHHLPHLWGNAKDLLANADPAHYTVVHNAPTNFPSPGSIVVWGSTWGGGYGHTAVVVAATELLIVVFEQNDPDGSPPVVATHDYSGVIGWLEFKAA